MTRCYWHDRVNYDASARTPLNDINSTRDWHVNARRYDSKL